MIKKLSESIGKYKKDSILSPLFVSLEVAMEVLIPWLMANLIDYGIEPGNMDYILKIGTALVISTLISLMFGTFAGHYAASASAGFAKNLRQKMYYNVQNFSFYNIDRFSTASLVTRLTTDVTNLQNSYQMIVRTAVRGPIMIIFSFLMAFSINAKLALIYLAMIPFL